MRLCVVTLVVVAVLAVVVVTALRLAVRFWVRSLGMGMAELMTDRSFCGLCERKDVVRWGHSGEPSVAAHLLSLCARLHCACVQRGLLSVPEGNSLVGFVFNHRRRRVAAVLRRDECAIVVFRCAVRVDELYAAIDVRREPGVRGGTVHAGFNRAYSSISDRLRLLIAKAGCEDVIVTGYSLGGTLATMAAVALSWTHSVELCVFAAPACVDKECSEALRRVSRVTSHVNTGDRVAMVRWGGQFVHVNPVYFHQQGRDAHAYGAYMRGLYPT